MTRRRAIGFQEHLIMTSPRHTGRGVQGGLIMKNRIPTDPTLSEDAGVATITLSRPTSLDSAGKHELLNLVEPLGARAELRALIVTASHPAAFLVDVAELADMEPSRAADFSRAGHRLANALTALPFPVIAAVEGAALGGGCELVLACDLAIAGEKATFGQIEAMGGVMPGFGGTWRLARRVGFQRACEMMFTGAVIDAATARTYGLVLEVAPAGGALAAARALSTRVAKTSPASVAAIKRVANAAWNRPPAEIDELEEATFPGLFGPEQSARMHGFLAQQAKAEAIHG
jgi:enoyl-CoA hydratase